MTFNLEKSSMFPNLYSWCFRQSYSVYMDVLESRQVQMKFKLVNLEVEDQDELFTMIHF